VKGPLHLQKNITFVVVIKNKTKQKNQASPSNVRKSNTKAM